MRQEKRAVKKERNYSIWFTGIVLILVYVILMNDMSEEKNSACKSVLKEQILKLDNSCDFSKLMLQ